MLLQPRGGLLLPRVNLIGTNNAAPLLANVAGMVVYNTAVAGVAPNAVTPGYYYNDGAGWVRVTDTATPNNDWSRTGNAGTNASNNFIGTTDNVSLRFRTFNTDKFEITTGNSSSNRGRLRAFENGDAAAPIYSWNSDSDTGMYRIGGNTIGFGTNGYERIRLSNTEVVFNETSNNYNFRIESNQQTDMFFVDASNNRIGIQTAAPAYNFHMLNSGNIGATAMANFENTGTDGVALSGINGNAANPYNSIEGAINYNGTAYLTAGVFGLSLAVTGNGIGTRGAANSSDGYGVYGRIPTTGSWRGYGGVFYGGLGYANGLYNLSDERAKKNITKNFVSIR